MEQTLQSDVIVCRLQLSLKSQFHDTAPGGVMILKTRIGGAGQAEGYGRQPRGGERSGCNPDRNI